MNTIKTERAQQIASYWHDGQHSALYQLCSGGFYLPNTLRYLKEIERCLHPEYALYPSFLTKKEFSELTSLKNWVLREAKKHSVDIEFTEHNIYGYLIPYVSAYVSDEIAAQITPLTYLI